ncbi:MAG TPA: polysaccharide deacetylase family protein [Cellvibrio sp.]|nr:polysaccharide deacetylase family protein [Cellvibrio sp.]
MLRLSMLRKWMLLLCITLLANCSNFPSASVPARHYSAQPPIRFLLTFDDGPSAATHKNPTQQIMDVLAHNQIQPGVKAIFFVQTRALRGGGTEAGQKLLRVINSDGHLLAFHTATNRHDNHTSLSAAALESSLQVGIADLMAISGTAPRLIRPPFWSYNASTLSIYNQQGLQMLLTDLSANDGKIHGVNWSWHKRSNLLEQLERVKSELSDGKIPAVDGSIPVVVTFHDVNPYTARNMELYMQILLDVAKELHLPMAEKPFYDDRNQLEKAALARTVNDINEEQYIPGFWRWWWGLKF